MCKHYQNIAGTLVFTIVFGIQCNFFIVFSNFIYLSKFVDLMFFFSSRQNVHTKKIGRTRRFCVPKRAIGIGRAICPDLVDSMTMLLPLQLLEHLTVRSVTTDQSNTITVKTQCSSDITADTTDNKFGHEMVVVPEITASILQDENDVMLSANLTHNVIRVQNTLEMMHECHSLVMIPEIL